MLIINYLQRCGACAGPGGTGSGDRPAPCCLLKRAALTSGSQSPRVASSCEKTPCLALHTPDTQSLGRKLVTTADQKVASSHKAKCWTSTSSHSDLDLEPPRRKNHQGEHLGVTSAMFEKLFPGHRGINCSRKRRAFVIRPTGPP